MTTAAKRNSAVDAYLEVGCGRCPRGGTPDCKVHPWHDVLVALREVALASPLVEDLKWKMPCYTYEGANVAMVAAFNDYCFFNFFKGVLLKDPAGILVAAGENSQSARQFRVTSVAEVTQHAATLQAYILEAIALEKAGAKVVFKDASEHEVPEELQAALDQDPDFAAAFAALTPGRQRSYYLHIAGAKQAATRAARVEKCRPKIATGKGFNER